MNRELLDDRGLHPLDSGYVFAVRRLDSDRRRRKFFKSQAEAEARARWWREQGENVEVVRYTIRNEEEVAG